MRIDKVLYKIPAENHYKTKTVKNQIVIGISLRKDNFHVNRLMHKDYGKTKKWNTYTINRNGKVYQHYDDKFHTDFMGIKLGDKQSVSIVLENMGYLIETTDGKYVNWLNEYCEEENAIEKKWMGYHFWEKFPDIQIENLVELCSRICDKHNIPKKCIDFNTYHKDIYKFRGIVFRSNYIEDGSDINPLINLSKFNEMLQNKIK